MRISIILLAVGVLFLLAVIALLCLKKLPLRWGVSLIRVRRHSVRRGNGVSPQRTGAAAGEKLRQHLYGAALSAKRLVTAPGGAVSAAHHPAQ